jgi:carbamate kinase
MLIVIALGGNALLQRGEPLEAELQRKSVTTTAEVIASLAQQHKIVICHGNGPQVGLLALQNEAYQQVKPYPLDILDAESQGMIGYLIQQEMGNYLSNKHVVTLLTQIIVNAQDPAFNKPTKPIGPVYNQAQAKEIAATRGWTIAVDGQYYRRVVPSPQPQEIVELSSIKSLLDLDTIVICGGGGGIPVIRNSRGHLEGVEAVIDKDNTAALIATKLNADALIILTDVTAVCAEWGTSKQRSIKSASCATLQQMDFASGSMGPKIYASCNFVAHTKKFAAIGRLFDIEKILQEKAGTKITASDEAITYYS